MGKYLLFFMAGEETMQDMNPSDPKVQEGIRKWTAWMDNLKSRGALESGMPLKKGGKNVGKRSSDYKMRKTDVSGYMVINAGSMEEAMKIAKESPHKEMGGKTVVRECMVPPM